MAKTSGMFKAQLPQRLEGNSAGSPSTFRSLVIEG